VVVTLRFVALALALAWPAHVYAQEEEPFGSAGQWVLTGSVGFRATSYERGADGKATGSDIWLSPGVLFFPIDGFAIGTAVLLERSETPARGYDGRVKAYGLGFHVRTAHHHALSDQVSLLPLYTLGYTKLRQELHVDSAPVGFNGLWPPVFGLVDEDEADVWSATALVPVLWHPARHVFLGGGPTLGFTYYAADDLLGREYTVSFGLGTVIAGWID